MKLAGLKVLDLTLFLPGPMLGVALAEHGAEVIKVEPPGEGDTSRVVDEHMGPLSVYFRNANRGKRSVQLDLKAEADKALFLRLASEADVILEGFRPGVAKRLGIDYEAINALNPRIVYCSISAYGQEGPDRHRPAHDLSVQAWSGVLSLNLGRDGAPAQPHIVLSDALSSMYGLSGVLMALLRRETTGQGDYLDISMYESLLTWTANLTGPVFGRGAQPDLTSSRTLGGAALYQIYETGDGKWIALGGSEPKFAKELLTGLGREDLIPAALTPPGRGQDPVKAFLTEAFKTRTQAEWNQWFEGRDICYAPVRPLNEALADKALTDSGFLRTDAEGYAYLETPMRFLREPGDNGRPAPLLNAHLAEVAAKGWRVGGD